MSVDILRLEFAIAPAITDLVFHSRCMKNKGSIKNLLKDD